MKKYLFPFMLLVFLLAAFPWLDQSKNTQTLSGLPWQIEILPDGSTRVFGLHLGVSRLADALDVLGDDMELAVIAAKDEVGNLEMYYGHYRAGLLSGKLVLLADAAEQDIRGWRQRALKAEPMPSGLARKYSLSQDDLISASHEVISGITFIPSVNLDEATLLARFGEPAERIPLQGVTHYRYPDRGLDIALYEEAKEVLQYVSPHDFQRSAVMQ